MLESHFPAPWSWWGRSWWRIKRNITKPKEAPRKSSLSRFPTLAVIPPAYVSHPPPVQVRHTWNRTDAFRYPKNNKSLHETPSHMFYDVKCNHLAENMLWTKTSLAPRDWSSEAKPYCCSVFYHFYGSFHQSKILLAAAHTFWGSLNTSQRQPSTCRRVFVCGGVHAAVCALCCNCITAAPWLEFSQIC